MLHSILGPIHLIIAMLLTDVFVAYEDVSKLINKFGNNGFAKKGISMIAGDH